MEKFEKIFARAAKRHGGTKVVEAELPKPKSAAALKKIPDDRWLAAMTKSVFQAGFVWRVIENKWPGFEDAFDGFDPHRIAFYADEDIERLAGDTRIVRNGAKILAARDNARFVCDLAEEYGSAGAFFAGSKPENFAGLLDAHDLLAEELRVGRRCGAKDRLPGGRQTRGRPLGAALSQLFCRLSVLSTQQLVPVFGVDVRSAVSGCERHWRCRAP